MTVCALEGCNKTAMVCIIIPYDMLELENEVHWFCCVQHLVEFYMELYTLVDAGLNK